jgi:hypothetical protein
MRNKLILLVCLFAASAQAAVDPLWSKVVEQAQQAKRWVPQDMELHIENDKDKPVRIKSHLQRWDNKQPVYESVQLEPVPDPAKPHNRAGGKMDEFSAMTDDMLTIDAVVKRRDGKLVDGQRRTEFTVEKSDGPMSATMQLWVDPDTGAIHEMQSHIHATFMIDVMMRTWYGAAAGGISLPAKTDFKLEVLIPFKGMKMHMLHTPSNWIERP